MPTKALDMRLPAILEKPAGRLSLVRGTSSVLDAIAKLKADKVDVIGWQFVDLSDNDSIVRSAEEITVKYPDLSLLVNNAGIPGDMSVPSYEQTVSDVAATVQVNYIGTFCLTKHLIPLLEKNHGRIVNITVPSLFSTYWHPMAYVASKAAQNTMTSIMAWEFDHYKKPLEIFDIHPALRPPISTTTTMVPARTSLTL